MSARGHSAIITYGRDRFNKFQRHTPSSCRRQQCCRKTKKMHLPPAGYGPELYDISEIKYGTNF